MQWDWCIPSLSVVLGLATNLQVALRLVWNYMSKRGDTALAFMMQQYPVAKAPKTLWP